MQGKRTLQFDDLSRVEYLSAPNLSPDGRHALYVINTSCRVTGGFISHIFEVPTAGGDSIQIAALEDSCEDMPIYSPDSKTIAFRSDRTGENQLWLYDRESGELRQLTTMRHGIEGFQWSPDGKHIALRPHAGRVKRCFTKSSTEKQAWEKTKILIVVEDLIYKLDEAYGMLTEAKEDSMLTFPMEA